MTARSRFQEILIYRDQHAAMIFFTEKKISTGEYIIDTSSPRSSTARFLPCSVVVDNKTEHSGICALREAMIELATLISPSDTALNPYPRSCYKLFKVIMRNKSETLIKMFPVLSGNQNKHQERE